MKVNNIKGSAFFLMIFCFIFSACRSRPTDKAIQQDVNQQLSGNENYKAVTVSVNKGIVTLSGSCAGENCVPEVEKAVKEQAYVDSVINNVHQKITDTIANLNNSLQKIVSKYPGVQGVVSDSIITLTGSLTEDQLSALTNEVSALQAKKVVDNIAVTMR